MQILENISLRPFNTFGIDVMARSFVSFTTISELAEAISHYPKAPKLILGGGSNILFTSHVEGLVARNDIKGINKTAEDDEFVYVRCR
jgi:UDP-N-acetylmuramate dehydrogenase